MPPVALALALAVGALLAACETAPPPAQPPPPRPAATDGADTAGGAALPPDTVDVQGVSAATARIEPAGAGDVRGTVRLQAVEGGVRVLAELGGLSQTGFHALQVLRGRDCGADPDVHLGAEAGPHGGPYALPGERHAGDLGNVRGDGGRGRYDRVDPALTLSGTGSAVGRAVVVRSGRDDAVAAGSGGAVVGCGVLAPAS